MRKLKIGNKVKLIFDGTSNMKNIATIEVSTGELAHCSPTYNSTKTFRIIGLGRFPDAFGNEAANDVIIQETGLMYIVYCQLNQLKR